MKTPYRVNIDDGIAETRRLVESSLAGVYGGMGDLTAYLSQGVGKGVRARVLLSAAMGDDGLVPPDAAKAAAAVELLHMATLVHDDVLDGAETRRGRPALHRKFDSKSAILCGDFLLSMSLAMLAGMETPAGTDGKSASLALRFAKALSSICQGEYSQHLHGGNVDIALLSYLRVISGKTAALFYVSAFSGALIGGDHEQKAFALGSFGRQLGMVFQIADDCRDYSPGTDALQRPAGGDLANGVVTLPLILAMRKNPALRDRARAVMKTGAETATLLAAVIENRGTEMAADVARRFAKKAERALAGVTGRKREALLALLHSVMPQDRL